MRPLILVAVISIVLACQHRQNRSIGATPEKETYTEKDARKFFEDSIAGPDLKEFASEKFHRFLPKYYPTLKTKVSNELIYAMEEPFVDTTNIDSTIRWFRVTVDPCFRRPYGLIIEKIDARTDLTIKVTSGLGGQYPGMLSSTKKYRSIVPLYDTLLHKLDSLNFWTLGQDTTCHGGLDGETWLIEAIDKGKYNAVSRWLPQRCGSRDTRALANLVKDLANESRLNAILDAMGAPASGL